MQHTYTIMALVYLKYVKDKSREPKVADIYTYLKELRIICLEHLETDHKTGEHSILPTIETVRNNLIVMNGYSTWKVSPKLSKTLLCLLGEEYRDVQQEGNYTDSVEYTDIYSLAQAVVADKKISTKAVKHIMSLLEIPEFSNTDSEPVKFKSKHPQPHPQQTFDKHLVFALPTYQDTILPSYFPSSYEGKFPNIEFKSFDTWEEISIELNEGRAHFLIHNLHTVVAHNLLFPDYPLYFFPKFTFHGYQIFLKNSSPDWRFKSLPAFEKRRLLESTTIYVEEANDFEWVLFTFFKQYGCDVNKFRANIKYENVNKAKQKFINDKSVAIYCTNSIHAKDLQKDSDLYESIGYGSDLTKPEHKNFNGLACLQSFYEEHSTLVNNLHQVWFDIIATTFIPTIKRGIRILNIRQVPTLNGLFSALMSNLNQLTGATIDATDFYQMFHSSNWFYRSPQSAKNGFLSQMSDGSIANNYKEIVLLQLGNEYTAQNIKQELNTIKQQVVETI